MVTWLIRWLTSRDEEPLKRPGLRGVYQPEPPIGFVPRSDPNFYFLNRR